AQPEALQGAARKQCHSDDRLCDTPASRSDRARADHADEREIFANSTSFRLYGEAKRAESACGCPQAWLAVRNHVYLILPFAARAQACRAFRHAALAGSAVHRAPP